MIWLAPLILGVLGILSMAVIFWILADMGSRGQVGRGVAYAFLFLVCWPVGLPVWLWSRRHYPRLVSSAPVSN